MPTLPNIPIDLNRRDFIKAASATTLSTLAATASRTAHAEEVKHPKPTADTCILLWMGGGMAAPDTFDPKRYEPFKVGLESKRIISTFPAIDTAVDHIKFTEGLEQIGKVMDRGTIIRSHTQADLGHILHSRHQYHWHTGYVPPLTVAAPHIGSWMSQVLGQNGSTLPAFIDVGQRLNAGEREELKAFHTGGFLGSEHGPFMIPEPKDAMAKVQPPAGMSKTRFKRRYAAYQKMVKASPAYQEANDYQRQSLLRSLDNAYKLMDSPAAKAFDLSLEPKTSYQKYDTGRFGRGCLLAKRLVGAGARFIEVTTEYIPFVHWDTHVNGHTTLKRLKSEIDRPIAQLILDLEKMGKLDRTLVVIASEFSRDMMIEGVPGSNARDQSRARADKMKVMKHYGLHRHFTGGTSVLMFGGGVKKGHMHGATAPERPCLAIKDPVPIEDLHATIYRAMGISPKHNLEIEARPFYVTKDGIGKPVESIFA